MKRAASSMRLQQIVGPFERGAFRADEAEHHALVRRDETQRREIAGARGVEFEQEMGHAGDAEQGLGDRVVAALGQIFALEIAAAHMHADRHRRRCRRDRVAERLDIEAGQPRRIVAVGGHPLAHDRVAQHGQRDFVELNIAAAGGGQRGDLGAIDRGKIAKEFFRTVIDAGDRIAAAAPKMHGRRRRQGRFRHRLGVVAEKTELIERDRPLPRHCAGHQRRGERELQTLLVAEGEARFADAQALGALDEAAPIRRAAEFTVGDHGKPGVRLQRDGVADRHVLRGGKAGLVERAIAEGAISLPQSRRAQQAADMVGAERRAMHGAFSWAEILLALVGGG